ncbi:MAG: sodium:panthothenate symporter [Lentisphaeria bacterium]|nr:sodium:panthothenate symporter [Lentisphaeria bacterium]
MSLLDWIIVIVPLALLMYMAVYVKRYAKSVVNFISAGRVAGRYLLSVGDMSAALSVIFLITNCEITYQTGWAVWFWAEIATPIGIFMGLTGFIVYRWRETRCLSFGQFLELRYGSKFFRVFCALLRGITDIAVNAVGPAITTNFFIYFLGLPHSVMIFGINLPCYAILVVLCVALSLIFILPGGRISLLISDCVQGLMCYPIFILIAGYILVAFSWNGDLMTVLSNRVEGESFLNPYDIKKLNDFNLVAVLVMVISSIINRGSWIGNDATSCALTPHEQKIAGVIGTFRNGFSMVLILVISMLTISFMNNYKFATANKFNITSSEIRESMSKQILSSLLRDEKELTTALDNIKEVSQNLTESDFAKPQSNDNNIDALYHNAVRKSLGDTPEGRYNFQQYRSLYTQMMMPTLMGKILPIGLVGIFMLLMVMLLISTDDSRIFNASTTIMQDVILPLFKTHLDSRTHIMLLRIVTLGVGVIFIVASLFMAQLDFIAMFLTIVGALWLGGAGPIVLFGLYSRFGNLIGAWGAIIFGSGTSIAAFFMQRHWAKHIYPFLEKYGWVEPLDNFLQSVSKPLSPWVEWRIDAVKFPINSYEIYFIAMFMAVLAYVIGSLITYKPYDLDKLLHRGKYQDKYSLAPEKINWSLRNIFQNIVGINSDYTKGDKIIAYAMFYYSIVYQFGIAFILIALWNIISPWPLEWWSIRFLISALIIPMIVGVVSTVWLMWGGIIDLKKLFFNLKNQEKCDENDNGQVL